MAATGVGRQLRIWQPPPAAGPVQRDGAVPRPRYARSPAIATAPSPAPLVLPLGLRSGQLEVSDGDGEELRAGGGNQPRRLGVGGQHRVTPRSQRHQPGRQPMDPGDGAGLVDRHDLPCVGADHGAADHDDPGGVGLAALRGRDRIDAGPGLPQHGPRHSRGGRRGRWRRRLHRDLSHRGLQVRLAGQRGPDPQRAPATEPPSTPHQPTARRDRCPAGRGHRPGGNDRRRRVGRRTNRGRWATPDAKTIRASSSAVGRSRGRGLGTTRQRAQLLRHRARVEPAHRHPQDLRAVPSVTRPPDAAKTRWTPGRRRWPGWGRR